MGKLAVVPPVGLEPTHLAPEASALSTELRGHALNIAFGVWHNKNGICSYGNGICSYGQVFWIFVKYAYEKMLELLRKYG